MINAATAGNIERKRAWWDAVQIIDGTPAPSAIDLNITELCNRSCAFCPRASSYPNQHLHMPVSLATKLAGELFAMSYRGAVVLCGFGEPTLHPHLLELVSQFRGLHVELVTSGDFLTREKVSALIDAGIEHFVVSLYDGPHQIAPMREMFEGVSDRLTIRDRWHPDVEAYGLKLTNRAGSINVGPQPAVDTGRPCFYPAYNVQIDWNGDVLLCPQDWSKLHRFGSIAHQSLWEIWTCRAMRKRRDQLLAGRRCATPCNGCNVDGQIHGAAHSLAWGQTRTRSLSSSATGDHRKVAGGVSA